MALVRRVVKGEPGSSFPSKDGLLGECVTLAGRAEISVERLREGMPPRRSVDMLRRGDEGIVASDCRRLMGSGRRGDRGVRVREGDGGGVLTTTRVGSSSLTTAWQMEP